MKNNAIPGRFVIKPARGSTGANEALVIPECFNRGSHLNWIPAFAGMTSLLFFLQFAGFASEIQGTVSVAPPYPESRLIQVKKKVKDSCADEQFSQKLIVSPDGALKNAVIFLKGDFARPFVPEREPVIDQKNCNYAPHVLIVPQGVPFKFTNADPVDHDMRGFDGPIMLFRSEMERGAKPVEEKFEKPGIHPVRCGLHPWMHAFVVSAPHAYYAVSDDQGHFILKDVPPGKYKAGIWHETLGEQNVEIEVSQPIEKMSYTFKA